MLPTASCAGSIHFKPLASRWHPHELTLMGSCGGNASDDFIAFGNPVMYSDRQVREGGSQHAGKLAQRHSIPNQRYFIPMRMNEAADLRFGSKYAVHGFQPIPSCALRHNIDEGGSILYPDLRSVYLPGLHRSHTQTG